MPGSLDPDPIDTTGLSPGPWQEDSAASRPSDTEIEDANGVRVARVYKLSDVTGLGIPWQDNMQVIMDAIGYGIQATDLAAELATAQADLATAQADLATAQADLATAQADLATAQADLATAAASLATALADLATAQSDLSDAQAELAEVNGELSSKRMELADTEQAIRRAKEESELTIRRLKRKRRKALRQGR